MKNRLLILINMLLVSIFNVLFRYVNTLNDLNDLNTNSLVISGYVTSSSVDVPYLKIFLFSFVLTFLFFTIVIIILKNVCDISFLEVIDRLNSLIFLLFIICGIVLLLFNTLVSFIFIIIGFVIFICKLNKDFRCNKYIYLIYLLLILYLLVLYFISF